jgi:hypothetical protein
MICHDLVELFHSQTRKIMGRRQAKGGDTDLRPRTWCYPLHLLAEVRNKPLDEGLARNIRKLYEIVGLISFKFNMI